VSRVLTVVAGTAAAALALATPLVLIDRTTADVSDAEVMGPNHLSVATFDVGVGPRTAEFSVTAMTPGDRAYGFVELTNDGDLPMVIELSSAGDGSALSEQLELALWPSPIPCSESPTGADVVRRTGLGTPGGDTIVGDPAPGIQDHHVLEPGTDRAWCVELHLPLAADNAVAGHTLTQQITVDAVHHVDPATTGPLDPGD